MKKSNVIKSVEKLGPLILFTALFIAYGGLIDYFPISKFKLYGASVAIFAGYEAIFSYLSGRMWTRGGTITATSNPTSFKIQMIVLAVISLGGVIMIFKL